MICEPFWSFNKFTTLPSLHRSDRFRHPGRWQKGKYIAFTALKIASLYMMRPNFKIIGFHTFHGRCYYNRRAERSIVLLLLLYCVMLYIILLLCYVETFNVFLFSFEFFFNDWKLNCLQDHQT